MGYMALFPVDKTVFFGDQGIYFFRCWLRQTSLLSALAYSIIMMARATRVFQGVRLTYPRVNLKSFLLSVPYLVFIGLFIGLFIGQCYLLGLAYINAKIDIFIQVKPSYYLLEGWRQLVLEFGDLFGLGAFVFACQAYKTVFKLVKVLAVLYNKVIKF